MNKSCKICGNEKKLVRDHCHNSLIIRGVLCQKCNHLLGYYESGFEKVKTGKKYKNWTAEYEEQIKKYLKPPHTGILFYSKESKNLKKELKPSWK